MSSRNLRIRRLAVGLIGFIGFSGTAISGTYEQIESSPFCEVTSPVFFDVPSSVGVIPSVVPPEPFGFFVDHVTRTGENVRVSWVTDIISPYEIEYGFDTVSPTSALHRAEVAAGTTFVLLPIPANAQLLHVRVGRAGCLPAEPDRHVIERRRVFAIPAMVQDAYYYDVLQRRTSHYKGGYTLYTDEQREKSGELGYRAILFSRTTRFQYQLAIPPVNGNRIIISSVYEDPNPDSISYGVGYRMTCKPSSELVFMRAYSAFPDRSDAKIVRIR